MTLPYVPETTNERCPRCFKKLVLDVGQDANTGWVHEHLSCWSCGYEVRERARPKAPPAVVEEMRRRRLEQVSKGETLEKWIGNMTPEEIEAWRESEDA